MGTAQHQRIDGAVFEGLQIVVQRFHGFRVRFVGFAAFHQRHQLRGFDGRYLRQRIIQRDQQVEQSAGHCHVGADHAHAAGQRRFRRQPRAGVDDADDGQVEFLLHLRPRHGVGGVAGHHHRLYVKLTQKADIVAGKADQLLPRPVAVGHPRRVAEEYQILVGQQRPDGLQGGQPPQPGIENAHRAVVV